jgi:hypothetical protein
MQKILCERAVLSEGQFSVACAPKTVQAERGVGFRFQWNQLCSPVHSLTLYRTNKQCASTGEMRRLKIDSLDQNLVQSIEKIQNLLHQLARPAER